MFALNIGCALALGMTIGLERQWRQHPGGLRTNTLVALGAAMFVSMSALMNDSASPTRIVSYVVSGLGFLGGGVILREGLTVKGINTAATIWCTGAIGSLSGAGFHLEAVSGTAAVLFVHVAFRPLVGWIDVRRQLAADVETYYRLRITSHGDHKTIVRNILLRHIGDTPTMHLYSLATEEVEKGRPVIVAGILSPERNDRFMEELVQRISIEPEVTGVSWEKLHS